MNAIVYTKEGKKSREVLMPQRVFGAAKNADLIHQVVTSMLSSARTPIAHTKNRGDVSGGGKKPWKQKGTGRARHGSTRSPIWVGGGVAHGPRNDKNFFKKVNKKMKNAALASVLSDKARDNEIILMEGFALTGKTKDGVAVINALAKGADISSLSNKKQNAAYILFADKDPMNERALKNIGNLSVGEARNLDVVSALKYKYLVFVNPEKSFEILESKFVQNDKTAEKKSETNAEAKSVEKISKAKNTTAKKTAAKKRAVKSTK